MTRTDYYSREEQNILRKENSAGGFTVRLHFKQDEEDDRLLEEMQKILLETYLANGNAK